MTKAIYVSGTPQRIKIYTSYYAMYKHINPMFQCVSIANSKPQSLLIPKIKELAPHWSLVKSYKNNEISRILFESMYMQHLIQNVGETKLRSLLLNLQNPDIVLMCYEKDHNECHRVVLANYINKFLPEFEVCGELDFNL